ncbi:hypothetical protein OZX73_08355 [Bifidobacterium sp. ESL0775]|uniref:hypothetical protein n=1 Tax=Bifidobacterium sp. ESL0775 TaxID=2983230 RepID=UPI0023FA1BF6|nr:hypothetical protein [Bifidobacterium sp. ESL0775]WEV69254.1 hypothetical protein OZX73_08355 [Bifidobacterium sp. ESL0775]
MAQHNNKDYHTAPNIRATVLIYGMDPYDTRWPESECGIKAEGSANTAAALTSIAARRN